MLMREQLNFFFQRRKICDLSYADRKGKYMFQKGSNFSKSYKMDKIQIFGGNPLVGEIKISGSKNSALPILAASLLTDEKLSISNVPKLI